MKGNEQCTRLTQVLYIWELTRKGSEKDDGFHDVLFFFPTKVDSSETENPESESRTAGENCHHGGPGDCNWEPYNKRGHGPKRR